MLEVANAPQICGSLGSEGVRLCGRDRCLPVNHQEIAMSRPTPTSTAFQLPVIMPTPMTRIDQVKYWFKPSFAFLIYALTVYIAASAPSRHTVLGRVSASLGTWIIVMLAKSSDVAFGFAVADAIDTMTWRKLTERLKINRGERFIGIRLEWFLALISSTGVEGLVKILARSRKKGWGRYTAGRWALLRLIFITALIPGPGIILTCDSLLNL